MSGRELLIEVRCLFPAIKVIAMSGSFCGSEVPSSVLADAFYPKGGVKALPQRSSRAFEHLRKERLSRIDEMEATLSDQSAIDVQNIENAQAVVRPINRYALR